jgi:hypothetical protein
VRLLTGVGSLVLLAGPLLVVALVNGGYVYRVECPKGEGSTETEWTYRWNNVIPYIGYDRSGCETHSGTRVALDALGIWNLGEGSAGETNVDHSSEYPPELREAMTDDCVTASESRAFCECAINEIALRLSIGEFEQTAPALRAGGSFDDLPEEIRGKARDAAVAAETDCR